MRRQLVAASAQLQGQYRDGTYRGRVSDAYYGSVQVQANIRGGQLVSVGILQYPNDRRTSRYINAQAIPILQRETIRAQSAHIDTVSGASLTSRAYIRSLSSALSSARAGTAQS